MGLNWFVLLKLTPNTHTHKSKNKNKISSHVIKISFDIFNFPAAPKIVIDSIYKEMTYKSSEKIKIEAIVTGSPVATFTISKDGIEVKPSARILVKMDGGTKAKMTITIDKCERNDLGDYTLTATNDLGSDSVHVKITVVGE